MLSAFSLQKGHITCTFSPERVSLELGRRVEICVCGGGGGRQCIKEFAAEHRPGEGFSVPAAVLVATVFNFQESKVCPPDHTDHSSPTGTQPPAGFQSYLSFSLLAKPLSS